MQLKLSRMASPIYHPLFYRATYAKSLPVVCTDYLEVNEAILPPPARSGLGRKKQKRAVRGQAPSTASQMYSQVDNSGHIEGERGRQACSKCSRSGHNARKCPGLDQEERDPYGLDVDVL